MENFSKQEDLQTADFKDYCNTEVCKQILKLRYAIALDGNEATGFVFLAGGG